MHSLLWLKELKSGNSDLIKAFELNSFGFHIKQYTAKKEKIYRQHWIEIKYLVKLSFKKSG